jgi:hypothetical protein
MRPIFDDILMKAATVVLALIVSVIIFVSVSDLPTANPLFGVFIYTMVPILFIAGAIVFILAILRI